MSTRSKSISKARRASSKLGPGRSRKKQRTSALPVEDSAAAPTPCKKLATRPEPKLRGETATSHQFNAQDLLQKVSALFQKEEKQQKDFDLLREAFDRQQAEHTNMRAEMASLRVQAHDSEARLQVMTQSVVKRLDTLEEEIQETKKVVEKMQDSQQYVVQGLTQQRETDRQAINQWLKNKLSVLPGMQRQIQMLAKDMERNTPSPSLSGSPASDTSNTPSPAPRLTPAGGAGPAVAALHENLPSSVLFASKKQDKTLPETSESLHPAEMKKSPESSEKVVGAGVKGKEEKVAELAVESKQEEAYGSFVNAGSKMATDEDVSQTVIHQDVSQTVIHQGKKENKADKENAEQDNDWQNADSFEFSTNEGDLTEKERLRQSGLWTSVPTEKLDEQNRRKSISWVVNFDNPMASRRKSLGRRQSLAQAAQAAAKNRRNALIGLRRTGSNDLVGHAPENVGVMTRAARRRSALTVSMTGKRRSVA
eukprot:g7889.t1